MIRCLISFLIVISSIAYASEKNFSGFVRDASNGEVIIGANIYFPTLKIGTSTNQYGFFTILVPEGKFNVRISCIGYKNYEKDFNFSHSQKIDIELTSQELSSETIVVTAKRENRNITSAEMNTFGISVAEIKQIPMLFGEQDIMKTIELLPGVTAAGEGSSGFYVRGGGPDENLILLDEAPVYNATHLLGFFSVFNSDALNSAKLYKGGGPVEYGGRLSSVLDIKMKEGNRKDFDLSGGIGLISSRLAVEGPIDGGKGSFFISGRRTYADLIMKAASPSNFSNVDLYFYDVNMKANYTLGEKDYFYFSGYLGRDVFGQKDKFGLDWGNTTATLRWNHIFSDEIFSTTSLIYSDFDYVVKISSGGTMNNITSEIEDVNLKQNLFWSINPSQKLNFGYDLIYHTFVPGKITAEENSTLNSLNIEKKYAIESGLYVGHEWQVSSSLSLNYGLRFSMFTLLGPGTIYEFDKTDEPISETKYSSGDVIKTYSGLEPRFILSNAFDDENSLKLSYSRSHQYIHLLSNSNAGGSMDVWHPSTSIVKPSLADQVSIGYFRNFDDNMFESSVEVYYKKMSDLVDYQDGADLLLNPYVESQLVFGNGQSYGLELFLKKKYGNFNGWLGYTLSRSERTFDDINNGKTFLSKNDRTHDISIVAMYQLNENWSFSANWVYNTGTAVTFPSGKYLIDGKTVNYYTDRNDYRMPDYHRLDLSATFSFEKKGRFESSITFSLYNAYGQKNPYSIYFRENPDNPNITEAVKIYLFSFFPSISFNFNW